MDPELILAKAGHKTRYVHVDHLIKAHDKVPNEIGKLDIPVPELWEQSNLGIHLIWTRFNQLFCNVLQPPVNFSDKDSEPNSGLNERHVDTPSLVVLRRSEKVRKRVVRLNL